MGYTIAITGKGGSGKTTISGLITLTLIKRGHAPVLVVDADPNICLDTVLGVKVNKSVGRIREEARDIVENNKNTGIPKRELLELKIAESLVEADNFDLIAMGRPEGAGCYCYANNVLREVIKEIANNYPYIVIDNEAGLENISRRITTEIDLFIIVGDSSRNGIETIFRLYELAHEMKIKYEKLAIIINRVREGIIPDQINRLKNDLKPDFFLMLPVNDEIAEWGEKGRNLQTLPLQNRVLSLIDVFISELI